MTKFKTNEEYILNELYKTQEELMLANKKINELEEQLKTPSNEEDMNCIYLSDKPYYWYSVDVRSEYNWNKILKDNNKTPKLVEKALTDDKALKQLCKLKEKDSWYSEIGRVKERMYNYLLKGRNGIYSVIETSNDNTYLYNISDENDNYLIKEEAEEKLKEKMIKSINYYLKHYKDKFEEDK